MTSTNSPKNLRVLVIDDEEDIQSILKIQLRKEGYDVDTASDGEEGLKLLMARSYDLAICDVRMPKLTGLELLDELKSRGIETMVIVMSAFGSKQVAIDAIKKGAYDYFDKPFTRDDVILTLAKAAERLRLSRERDALRILTGQDDTSTENFHGIIGASEEMQKVFKMIGRLANVKSTVLLSGESGTGKEVVARAIHNQSDRADKPLVALNCGAIPEALIESELFGHKRGSFTDASQDKQGLFEAAQGGTIFLDEIAELPLATQVKLLRVVESLEVRRVGESQPRKVDVRVIAASLHDLETRVKEGLFREDLFYRLHVIQITLPPLRQRLEDLDLLIDHFVAVQNTRQGTQIKGVSPEALSVMKRYSWPGNVRELQNCIERGVVMSVGDQIELDALPDRIRESNDELQLLFREDELSIKKMSEKLERILIRRALERTGGNRTNSAKLLEISHRALLYKIKEYGLERVGLE